MTFQETIEQLTTIIAEVIDNEDLTLTPETTASDVEDWDSLTHIQIIVAAEKHFKVKFTAAEITSFRNVGHFCEEILRKKAV